MAICPVFSLQTQGLHKAVSFLLCFFIMYTDSCRTSQLGSYLVKFSDDTALLSLLQGAQSGHGSALSQFVNWCDDNFLDLNVTKTKELIIDFRKNQSTPEASIIHGENVEIVETYKYLGTMFDSNLRFDKNTESIIKRGQQRIHLMRKLNSFNVSQRILCYFYHSFIESLLTFSFTCWFYGLSVRDKNRLNSIVRICSKIIGAQLTDLSTLWKKRVLQKARQVMSCPDHVLSQEFCLMPSGRRYLAPPRKTNRYARSFIPSAITFLNADS